MSFFDLNKKKGPELPMAKGRDKAASPFDFEQALAPFAQEGDPGAVVLELKTLTQEVAALRDVVVHQAMSARPAQEAVSPTTGTGAAMDEVTDFLYRKLQYPLVRDLMLYFDRLAGAATTADEATSLADLRATVVSFRDEIGDLLREHGVELIDASGSLDPQFHQRRSAVDTSDRTMHNQIARVIRHGFVGHGTVLRKAEVEVYKYATEALS